MNGLWWAALLSMTPIVEMQGGIPVALASGASPLTAFVVCVIANLLVMPILFFFLEEIHHRFLHVKGYQSLFDKFMERIRRKVHPLVEKYGIYGLIVLVALPGPGTGVYTATVASWFFGLKKRKAYLAISVGMVIAASLVLAVSLGVMNGWKFLAG